MIEAVIFSWVLGFVVCIYLYIAYKLNQNKEDE